MVHGEHILADETLLVMMIVVIGVYCCGAHISFVLRTLSINEW